MKSSAVLLNASLELLKTVSAEPRSEAIRSPRSCSDCLVSPAYACSANHHKILHDIEIEDILVELLSGNSDCVKIFVCQAMAGMSSFLSSKERFREIGPYTKHGTINCNYEAGNLVDFPSLHPPFRWFICFDTFTEQWTFTRERGSHAGPCQPDSRSPAKHDVRETIWLYSTVALHDC